MAKQSQNKKKLIEGIMRIINGEADPGKPICILWDDDPASDENIYMLNGRKVNYEYWKNFK